MEYGVKLKADRSSGAIDGLIFDTNRQTTQTFLIKRGEVEKAYTLTSEFVPAGFKKKSNTPNEVVNVVPEVQKTETSEKQ